MILCDLCNRQVDPSEGGWTYYTPSTADQRQAFHGEGFWAEDERWFVCNDCLPLVEAEDTEAIAKRWLRLNPHLALLPARKPTLFGQWEPCSGLEYAVLAIKSFMANKSGERTWEDVVSPGGPSTGGT